LNIPEISIFAYDVADEIADKTPEKVALVWCNDRGEEATFTFGQLKELQQQSRKFL